MSEKYPIFPIPQSHPFSDYGFEPQFEYYQILEEAKRHKSTTRSIDLHFKLQKPIVSSRDDSSKKIRKHKKRWWRNPLLFFKFPRWSPPGGGGAAELGGRIGSASGPIYIVESRSGSSTPHRTGSRPGSGPLARGEVEIPYISLGEFNVGQSHRVSATSGSPIYLVT